MAEGKPIQKALVQILGRFFRVNEYLLLTILDTRTTTIQQ